MRVLIENYRSWEICFDTDKEDFYTVSNEYDRQETKRSYASAKKYIDDYIKENNVFKPIKVQKMPSMFSGGEVITLIGIRKDKAFMYEDKDGKKQQLSGYNESDYFIVDSKNDVHFKRIAELAVERKKIDAELKEIEKSVIKVDVKQIRKNLFNE
jgi:hypothetical protein